MRTRTVTPDGDDYILSVNVKNTGSLAGSEGVQFYTNLGTFDVDDVLLNLVGAAMGYAVTKILEN